MDRSIIKLHRQKVITIINIFLLILLCGCSAEVIPLSDKPLFIQRWMNDAGCTAPCWEGIQPGVTKITEIDLNTIASTNLLLQYQLTPMWRNNKLEGNFDYWWDFYNIESQPKGYIHLSSTNYIFDMLYFSFFDYISLKDAIAKFGTPDSVVVDYSGIEFVTCRATLFFKNKLIWVMVQENSFLRPQTVNIKPETHFTAYYVSKVIRDELVVNKFLPNEPSIDYRYDPSKQEQKWEGYKTYRCISQ